MRNIKLVAAGLAVAASAFAVKPASATPSTLGFYPSTDIYGKGNLHLDLDDYASTSLDNDLPSTGLTYGFGPDTSKIFGRTEAGFDYFFGDADLSDKVTFNVKTQLYDNSTSGTRVVLGGWGLGSKDAAAPNYIYLTGSKTFKFGRITLGVAQALEDDIITEDKTSLQLGYDKMFGRKLQFVTDYYTGNGELSGVQPTFYYSMNSNASFGLGYFHPNNGDLDDQIYLCFDYNFPTSTPTAPNPANPGADAPGTPTPQ